MDDLAKLIADELANYAEDIAEAMEEETEQIATEAAAELRATSPKRTGGYAKSWRKKKDGTGYVVYSTKPGLPHLLEKGHAKRNGGRTMPIVHIKPVELDVIDKFEKSIERRARG